MDNTLDLLVSNPDALKNDPAIMDYLMQTTAYQVLKKLGVEGSGTILKKLGDDPVPGVTLNYDKINTSKNYKTTEEYCYIPNDVVSTGNTPVSQILHNQENSRVLVPYANLGRSPSEISAHIQKLRESIMRVFAARGDPIQEANIITNQDDKNNTVLQIAVRHVGNLGDNKKFTDLIKRDIDEHYPDETLKAAINHGYEIFKYNENFQKYPLFKDPPPVSKVYTYLFKDIHGTPVTVQFINPTIINNVSNINGNNNNVTFNVEQSTNITLEHAMSNFVNMIKEQRPAWYKEGAWMHLDKLREHFTTNCHDPTINPGEKKFNKLAKMQVGKRTGRKLLGGLNRTAVLLKKYDEL